MAADGEAGGGTGGPAAHDDTKGHRARAKARFLRAGADGLDDYELLELLLFAPVKRGDTKAPAKALLRRFGSLGAVLAAKPGELTRIPGIGEACALHLNALHAVLVRSLREPAGTTPAMNGAARSNSDPLSSAAALRHYVKARLEHYGREFFRVVFLNSKNFVIADEDLGLGTVAEAPVYPREIGRRALELEAASVILVHNHPSGDPTPSRADEAMTREVVAALSALGIPVHDHLVVARSGTVSMRAEGLM